MPAHQTLRWCWKRDDYREAGLPYTWLCLSNTMSPPLCWQRANAPRVVLQEALICEELAEWQGPGLVLYNSAPPFSSDDLGCFTRKVGDSAKAGDSSKIGQFGLGAITAYHFTDIIQLLTDGQPPKPS